MPLGFYNMGGIPNWRENVLQALGSFIQATRRLNRKEESEDKAAPS